MVNFTNISYLIVIFLFLNVNQSNGIIDDVLDVIHVAKDIVGGVLKAWDIVEQTNLAENIELPITREKQKKVLRRLKELSRQIEQNEQKFKINALWTVETITDFVQMNTALELKMHEMNNIINQISSRLRTMEKYEENREKFEKKTLIQFCEWTVSPNSFSIQHLLDRLYLLFAGNEETRSQPKNGILTQLADNLEDARDQICVTKQSPQQFLYSLYSDIALTELKGYTMMQFSWMLLRIYEKGNYTQEAALMREDFEKRAYKTQLLLREVMKRSDRTLWTCDPIKHIKGQTYDEVTRLLQGYIENEVDMNTEETCRENCAYYQIAKNNGCFKDLYCSRQPRCTGKLLNCQYIDSDMWICPASLNSTRRYEYIEYENGRLLGEKSQCVRGSTKVDSWWRWLFWHCSYCFCMCDEQSIKSDRYFNLRESLATTASNKVITGLRFVKHKRVFHIQIQEGELLPQGNIKLDSVQWKPVDNYNIFDSDVKSGVDYHTLAWDKRAIDLDDLTADDPTHVVIGIRMRTVGAHLNLEVKLCEYDYEKGKLINPATNSFWKSNDNTDLSADRRTQIYLRNPDIIRPNSAKSLPDSKHNQYIEFTNSDMDKDAAQSTVPFIDIQDVISNPPVPLSGVGLYHKGRHQLGGFIAPKLITYDFTPHIQTPIKE